MAEKKHKLTLVPPLFERPWASWNLPVKPFQTELLPSTEQDHDPVEVAYVSKYLELADILLRSDEEPAAEPARQPLPMPRRVA